MNIKIDRNPTRVKSIMNEIRGEKSWASRHDNMGSLDENPRRGEVFVRSRNGDRRHEVYKEDYPADPRVNFYSQQTTFDSSGTKEVHRIQQARVSHEIALANGEQVEILPGQVLYQEFSQPSDNSSEANVTTELIVDHQRRIITEFIHQI